MNLEMEYESSDKYSLHGKVFNSIREDILSGKLLMGESLKETILSKRLGVSRTPIREAIRQLELEGLVKSIPNKGVVVTGISDEDILDIFDIRIRLEGLAIKKAVEKITEDELNQLKEVIELMEFYSFKNNFENLISLDTKFHKIIYKAAESKSLNHILEDFHYYLQRSRKETISSVERMQSILEEHQNIFKAVKERNLEEAEEAMKTHVLNAKLNVMKNTSA